MDVTFEANSDLSAEAKQYTFVGLVAGPAAGPNARVDTVTSGEHRYIMQNRPKSGKGAVVRNHGFSSLRVDGTSGGGIAVGSFIKPSTGGKGVVASAGDAFSAIACEASTADGDVIEVWCERGTAHA